VANASNAVSASSGAKGRDKRPGLDTMLRDAVVMAWAIDRLGRSLIDLLGTISHLEAVGVDLYLEQQAIDTTTPMGKLLFQITGAFAEFERSMIRQRIHAGLKTVKAAIAAKGSFTARSSGIVRKRLGRPGADPEKLEKAAKLLAQGVGILATARKVGLGTGTVQRLKQSAAAKEAGATRQVGPCGHGFDGLRRPPV
jgi:DNA invertase Pin-like site-specific DNA recombinase